MEHTEKLRDTIGAKIGASIVEGYPQKNKYSLIY